VLLRTFIDDSWDQTREFAVTAGAYVGYSDQWRKLRDAWKKRLKQAGIRYFRSTEYYSLQGEFLKFRDPVQYPKPKGGEAAKTLRSDLFDIIKRAGVEGFAVSLPIAIYNDVLSTEPYANRILPPKDHAFVVAIQELFSLVVRSVAEDLPGQRISFICDDSSEYSKIASVYYTFKQLNPGYAKYMETIIALDDKKHPQLQAADVMAHLAKERYKEFHQDQKPDSENQDLNDRIKDLSVYRLAYVNRERLVAIVQHEAKRRGLSASV